jgi:imidazolonepropionase-like amidohydrolase
MIHARSAPHTTVVVEGDRIASVGPASAVKVPRGCERIDGQHRYLIPGLIDTHVHFFGYRRDVEGSPKVEEAILNMLLANGVTTALVMEGSPAILRLREAVANGERIGPRLYVSGPLLQAPHTGELPGRQTFATPAQIQQEIVDEKRRGYDFVKVHGAMPAETYGALLAAAKANHLSVIGHVPDNLGLDAALAGGQVMIAHAESYLQTYFEFERQLPTDPAEIDRMVADVANRTAGAGVFVQPTLSVFRQIIAQVADVQPLLDRPAMKMLPSEATADWQPGRDPYLLHWSFNDIPRFRAEYALMQRLVRGLRDARVPLLIGSDDMVPLQLPGFSVQDEMKQMQEAGLTPYEVLEAATASAGRFFGPNSKVGVIVPGSMADLVLLDANPLLDTANAFRQDGVMLRGRWFTEGELQRRLWASADGGVSVAAIKLVGPAF